MPAATPTSPLSAAFLAERKDPRGVLPEAELEAVLAAMLARAHAAWPQLGLADVAFVEHLARRFRLPEGCGVREALEKVAAEDLYLAASALAGLDLAVVEVERRVMPNVLRTAQHLQVARGEAEELRQEVVAAVLVGGEGGPALAGYLARGPLDAWLRATELDMARTGKRSRRREVATAEPELAPEPDELIDPELAVLKERYRAEFNAAFERALSNLGERDRNVLRMYLLDGLNIEAIGLCYRVHRATVARWIANARERIFADTMAALREQVAANVSESELASIARLLQSQIEVSIGGVLRRAPPG
ncbi:MAG: sigma-70 family RNA polymerase sigma factor [Myxococcales bacterium]